MNEYWGVWMDTPGVRRILLVTVAIVMIHTLAVFSAGVVALPGALVTPAAILLGPAGVWGVAIGATVFELGAAGLSTMAIARMVELLASGIIALALWRRLPRTYRGIPRRAVVAVIPIAVVAALIGAGVSIVTIAASGGPGAAALVPVETGNRVALSLVLAPAIVGLWQQYYPRQWDGDGVSLGRWVLTTGSIGILALAWLLGTGLFGLVHRDRLAFEYIGAAFEAAFPTPVDRLVLLLSGEHGWVTYVIGAAVVAILIGFVLRLTRPSSGNRSSSGTNVTANEGRM